MTTSSVPPINKTRTTSPITTYDLRLTSYHEREDKSPKKGKPCGKGYIAQDLECRQVKGNSASKNELRATNSPIKSSLQTAAIATGAALLGVPVATYLVQKARFKAGYAKSAELAKEQAKTYSVPEKLQGGLRNIYDQTGRKDQKTFVESKYSNKEADQITFVLGGFGGKAGLETDYRGEEVSTMFPTHHVVNVETPEQDVLPKPGDNVGSIDYLSRVVKTNLGKNLKNGRNDIAVRATARISAYHEKYPDKPINIIGQSGGAMPAREAAILLRDHFDIQDVKVVSAAGPYFGLSEPIGITLAAPPEKDALIGSLGRTMPNKVPVKTVESHGRYFIEGTEGQRNWDNGRDYTAKPNKEVQSVLTDYFKREEKQFGIRKSKVGSKEIVTDSLIRQDKGTKGKPCGKGYIPKDFKCRQGSSSNSSLETNVLRLATSVRSPTATHNKIVETAAIATGAALVGVPVATYLTQKVRFQNGFSRSAELATLQAQKYYVPNTVKAGMRSIADQNGKSEGLVKTNLQKENAKQLTFFVGGIGGKGGMEGDHMGQQFSSMFPDHHVVAIENPEQDVTGKPGENLTSPSYLKKVTRTFLKDNLTQGRSDVAVRVAARAYAYHQAHPSIPINLVGQSGGTMPAREAAEILEKLEIKDVKVVSSGGPYFGLTKPKGITLISPLSDPANKIYGVTMPNKVEVNTVKGHSLYYSDTHYKENLISGKVGLPNPEVKSVLSNYFKREEKKQVGIRNSEFGTKETVTDSLVRQDKSTKGKPCGKGYISKDFECKQSSSGKSSIPNSEFRIPNSISSPEVISALKSPVLLTGAARILSTAAVVGLPVAATTVAREKYKSGLPQSAVIVKERVDKINPKTLPNFSKKSQITFVQTGFTGAMGPRREAVGNQMFFKSVKKLLPNHGVVGRYNKEFNIPQISEDDAPEDMAPSHPDFFKVKMTESMKLKFAQVTLKQTVGTFFTSGRNPESLNLATDVYAQHLKNPNKPINIIGHSAGSMISREGAAILKELGVNTKVVTIGGPDFGVIDYPNVKHFHSKNDPVTGALLNPKAEFYNDITSHSAEGYIQHPKIRKKILNYFNTSTKNDSIALIPNSSQRVLTAQIKLILSRVYQDPIDQMGKISVSDHGKITALFRDDRKILELTIQDDDISYKLRPNSRIDSYFNANKIELEASHNSNRTDSKKRKNRCEKGISCGLTCIAANKSCDLKMSAIASPHEVAKLRQTVARFQIEQNNSVTPSAIPQEQPPTPTSPSTRPDYVVNPKTGQNYTIRELKEVARQKQIYRYSEMTSEQLRESLKANDADPQQRERLRRTLTERGLGSRSLRALGIAKGKNATAGERRLRRGAKNTVDDWRRLEMLAKFAGSAPASWGAAAVGAFLLGATIRTYERTKGKYREGLFESAQSAQERAVSMNIQHPVEKDGRIVLQNGKPIMTSKFKTDNITFAVGSGQGYGAEQIKSLLQKEIDPTNKADYWFTHSNEVIPFNLKEFGTPEFKGRTQKPDGSYTEPYVAHVVTRGIGNIVRNYKRKRNQDSVDLAATIYAHAIAVDQLTGKNRVNKDKKINILAHSAGGMVTKEALEILSHMQLKGSPSGKDVLNQVNAVYLGTPHFGFAENVSKKQRTIVSAQDPVSALPVFGSGSRQQWISTVKGHGVDDYLNDDRVRDAIRESFGYYQGSPNEIRRRIGKSDSDKSLSYLTSKVLSESEVASRPQSFGISISNILAEALGNKPEHILTVNSTSNDWSGKFLDSGIIYNYSITESGIEYQENRWDSRYLDAFCRNKLTHAGIKCSSDNSYEKLKAVCGIRSDFFGPKQCKNGVRCGNTCLPRGSKCNINKPKSSAKRYKDKRLTAKLGRGPVARTIGGIGQDLERAFLRTQRLVQNIKRKIQKKERRTNREKFINRTKYEAKQVGVLLGQGKISKILKDVDTKLIDLREKNEDVTQIIQEKLEPLVRNLNNLKNRSRRTK